MASIPSQNLTIGKGIVWLAPHLTPQPVTVANGFEDMGNAPGLSLAINTETISHYSSRGGIRLKDDETTIEINRTGTLTIDDMKPSNLAKFFMGSVSTVSIASDSAKTETFAAVKPGIGYQLGVSAQNPAGVRKVTGVTVSDADTPATIYTVNVDYIVDLNRGFIEILPGGALAAGDIDITVEYDVEASTHTQIIAGDTEVAGSMLFQASNPKGELLDYLMPYVKIRPSGDLQLISDEYMQVEFNVEVLALGNFAPVYLNGQPV